MKIKILILILILMLVVSATLAHADFNLDVDDDGKTMPLTDGLLVIRHLFGFTGDALVSGAVATDANRKAPDAISDYLKSNEILLDIDADGKVTPLTDGLLLIRGLFGFSGPSLSQGAIGSDSLRTDGEGVATYLTTITDSDNDGANDAFDVFPGDPTESVDTDGDLIGNNADTDDDNDGVLDTADAFSLISLGSLTDTDGDGRPNDCDSDCTTLGMTADTDDDNDGVLDTADAFSLISLGSLTDTDGDGRPNDCDSDCTTLGMTADTDDDNDGVADSSDAYPLNANVHTAPAGQSVSVALNLLPQTSNSVSGTAVGTAQDSRSVTYTLVSSPSHSSSFTLNSSTGAYSYATTETVNRADTFTYTVNDGFVDSATATVTINLNTDPLYKYQWHLNNIGQTNFATNAGTSGQDLNVDTTIVSGYTGNGITVAVIDSGLELAHEDLANNIVSGSYDFLNSDTDPTNSASDGDHGTSVAGIIASSGWNNKGGRGVAPKSSLVGFNLLKEVTSSNEAKSWGSSPPTSVGVDVYNLSYGTDYCDGCSTYSLPNYLSRYSSTLEDALKNGVNNLRGGKGAIYVKSSGNAFSEGSTTDCGSYLACTEMTIDPRSALPYFIGVGSLAASGVKSSYTTPGSAMWISGFGGEYGNNSTHSGLSSSGGNNPAITTVDQSSCSAGYVKSGVSAGSGNNYNAFNNGDHSENTECNYVSTFNGTSSAAPSVSGVVALMLEANSALTWRDVKHILATTADQVDASRTYTLNGIPQYEWETNSAGYKFHNWYGFGKIDAAEAVTTAASYTADSRGSFVTTGYKGSGTLNATITQANVLSTINVTKPSGSNDFVEFVRVTIRMSHSAAKTVGFRLQSPDGTVINILQPYTNIGTNPELTVFDIGVGALYGESVEGSWTLVANDYLVDGVTGSLTYWGVEVFGN